MKMYYQIAILLGICLAADLISAAVPFPFPTNVTAMALLLLLLFTGLVKLDWVEHLSDLLINNMQIMFIPSACSLMISYQTVLSSLGSFLLICVLSTLITWLVTYYTIAGVTKLQHLLRNRKAGMLHD